MRNFLLLLVLFITSSSSAQRMLSLEEAIATALKQNYAIQLSKNDSAVAALDYSFRNAAFLPRVNGNLGTNWTNNNQKQKFADGTERKLNDIRSNNYSAAVQLNWVLFDGLKMFATRDKAQEFIKLGGLGIKNQVINTIAAVITNYYAIVRQKQQLKAIQEQLSLSRERVKLAQYKLDIGVGAKPDVLQSKVDLNAQNALQLNLETQTAQLKEQLNQVMNVEANTSYEVSDTIPINMRVALADIQQNIEKNNPLLLIAEKNIDIARFTLKERKAERFPILSLNSSYNYSRNNNKATVNPFQPLYSRNFGRNIGFTVSIPVLNNLNTKRLIKQAEIDIQYQQLVYDNQKSIVSLSIINAYKDYELQKRALALEEENILLAKENVDIVFQVYKLNSTTLIQLKEAQKSLQDAYTRLIDARYNTKLAETELLRLKGDLVK
ncbi:MAG: TolC family protein [Chitinophagaceae bacterium]|nr:TolC family protein [Chitinophagaceae bacterium]MBL0273496.1 TolC family protein [Chitinophagaceae bacterium]